MKKQTTCMILAGMLTFGTFAGCSLNSDGSVTDAKTWDYLAPTEIVYDCLGGDGEVMPFIGFWSSPPEATVNGQWYPTMKNDEYFTAVKESGINLLMPGTDKAVGWYDELELTMDYCDEYGMGVFVQDYDLVNLGALTATASEMREALAKYAKEHKSFAGLNIRDEPPPSMEVSMNKSLTTFYNVAEELGLNIHGYANLYPYTVSHYSPDPWTKYVDHATTIFKGTGAKMIAYDIYPLKASGMDYIWYFSNLSMIRSVAEDLNIAWTPFVSVSAENNYLLPKEGELAWQVNQYIAFGAKGINYFPINGPISFSADVAAGDTIAMFDYLGNKTEVYYYVKEVSKQLQAADHYLMKASNHGVIIQGELIGKENLQFGEVIQEGAFRELTKVSGDDATVGCFDYYGKTCLYVVNNSMYEDGQVQLNFDDRYAYEVIQRGQTANVKGKKITLNLSAGEAAFIILK